jgi:hypothetical protein
MHTSLWGLTLLAFCLAPHADSSTVPAAPSLAAAPPDVLLRPAMKKVWTLEDEDEDAQAAQGGILLSELAELRGIKPGSEIDEEIRSALSQSSGSASLAGSQAHSRMDEGTLDDCVVPDIRSDMTKMTKDKLKPAEPRPQTIGRVFDAARKLKKLGDLRPDRLLISIGWKARQTVTDIQNFLREIPLHVLPSVPCVCDLAPYCHMQAASGCRRPSFW